MAAVIQLHVRSFNGLRGRYSRLNEWDAGQRRMTHETPPFVCRYLPARVKCRYWIAAKRQMGRVHIATGRAVRVLTNFADGRPAWVRPDQIVVELHCRQEISYARGIDSPDSAPGFTLCPRCVMHLGDGRCPS